MKEFIQTAKNKNFVHLWVSQILSQLVINTLSFLILTRIFEITGSTIAVSFVWVAYALPAIIFGPIGAVSADVVDKRKLLLVCNILQALTVLLFASFYKRYIFLSYAVVFIYSFFNQFYVPAEAATLPHIVKKSRLPQANSLFFITVQSGLAAGFVSAGLLYDAIGFGTTLTLAAGLLLVAAFSVSQLPTMRPKNALPKVVEKGISKFFQELVEGYGFIKDNRTILFPFLLLIGLQAALSVVVVSLPVVTTEIIKTRASLSGLVVVAPAAAGALAATLLVSRLLGEKVRKRKIIELSVLALSACLIIISSVVPNVYFWLGRSLAVISFFVAGMAYVGGLVPSLTYLQEVTPDDLMGRVFGNIWFITTVATVLPVLFSATITEIFGVKLMLLLLGLGGIAVAFASRLHNYFNRKVTVHV